MTVWMDMFVVTAVSDSEPVPVLRTLKFVFETSFANF